MLCQYAINNTVLNQVTLTVAKTVMQQFFFFFLVESYATVDIEVETILSAHFGRI